MNAKESLIKILRCKWTVAALVIVGSVSLAAGTDYLYYRTRLFHGVALNEIPLGGLRLDEAEKQLEEKLWSIQQLVLIMGNGERKEFPLDELGITWDKHTTMDNLYRAGRGWAGYRHRINHLLYGTALKVRGQVAVDEPLLARVMSELAGQVYQPPRDAFFEVNAAEVNTVPEYGGRFLRVQALRELMLASVYQPGTEIAAPVGEWPASRTAAELQDYGVEQVMAAFDTDVSPGIPNRAHNIRLGAAAINGYLLAPGEIFSFSEVVGRATREKGYLEAPIIVGEELVPGLGGGLCQVSSTLYNAALMANLAIVERYNHTLTVSYLPPGRDATVSIGHLDLKFQNNRDHYLLIGADLHNLRLTFRIFGPPMEERVEIHSSGLRQLDPPVRYEQTDQLPPGVTELLRPGKPGYYITTWRVVYRNDREISRELLGHDYYRPTTTVYLIGTGNPGSG